MKKIFLFLFCFLVSLSNFIFANEINFSVRKDSTANSFYYPFLSTSKISFSGEELRYYTTTKEKIKIFDKPDTSWFKEKNRMEKMFIGIGVASSTIGFSMLLAGLINLFVPFDAVSIDGKPIIYVRNAYISVLSTGAGLMVTGVPFILVGSIRLGLQKKADKQKAKEEAEK
jgi:hypothetical protein